MDPIDFGGWRDFFAKIAPVLGAPLIRYALSILDSSARAVPTLATYAPVSGDASHARRVTHSYYARGRA